MDDLIDHSIRFPRLARVFPRRTKATPKDSLVFIGGPPIKNYPLDVDEVHVSATFTWDKPRAEYLAEQWKTKGYNVKLGGPAYDAFAEEFVSGRYLSIGNIITSRGCHNNCWFCLVPKREGRVMREQPICNGWNLHDSNILMCSDEHIKAVFAMLDKQKQRAAFIGGLEAATIKDWHIKGLREIKAKRLYFAYDTPDDLKPLQDAGQRLQDAGFVGLTNLQAFVLIGYPKDTMEAAEKRCREVAAAGFLPYAMLYRNKKGEYNKAWRKFQYTWSFQPIVHAMLRGTRYSENKIIEKRKKTLFSGD